jgi:protein tyrosine phosphatase (PTP) superfamily phosphohydrolase (DUF442 family)
MLGRQHLPPHCSTELIVASTFSTWMVLTIAWRGSRFFNSPPSMPADLSGCMSSTNDDADTFSLERRPIYGAAGDISVVPLPSVARIVLSSEIWKGSSVSAMNMKRVFVRTYGPALLIALSLVASATAQTNVSAKPTTIRINNFGQINSHYYRGAQPEPSDYADLAALGIKTVIDLTRDGRIDEKRLVEAAGMRFYRIPMTTTDRPSEAAVTQFLKLVNDSANQPVYVHCQGGRHRTGVMTAVYRMTGDAWTADRAYQEMKQYKFEGFPSHPTLKSFVFDYYGQLDGSRIAENQPAVETTKPSIETATK